MEIPDELKQTLTELLQDNMAKPSDAKLFMICSHIARLGEMEKTEKVGLSVDYFAGLTDDQRAAVFMMALVGVVAIVTKEV